MTAPQNILGDRDGETFHAPRDRKRLNAQCQSIYNLMADGRWRTLTQISAATCHPEASCSARLRDLRKNRFGGYTVERRYIERGLYSYRLVI